ncbi:hypothetical protein SCHPADRAFT_891590 [Schizopora paradoxa]|uniref:Uncharacterized protein n=1 Tax=Schizopora paradoxa TaxID=27342 RepID=A0A0H2RPS0_9AGAM|nr:hypothetical protein SCHPADRAFT_891590 [Schizopora paradoxa]
MYECVVMKIQRESKLDLHVQVNIFFSRLEVDTPLDPKERERGFQVRSNRVVDSIRERGRERNYDAREKERKKGKERKGRRATIPDNWFSRTNDVKIEHAYRTKINKTDETDVERRGRQEKGTTRNWESVELYGSKRKEEKKDPIILDTLGLVIFPGRAFCGVRRDYRRARSFGCVERAVQGKGKEESYRRRA